jgi:hypothetical protein
MHHHGTESISKIFSHSLSLLLPVKKVEERLSPVDAGSREVYLIGGFKTTAGGS